MHTKVVYRYRFSHESGADAQVVETISGSYAVMTHAGVHIGPYERLGSLHVSATDAARAAFDWLVFVCGN